MPTDVQTAASRWTPRLPTDLKLLRSKTGRSDTTITLRLEGLLFPR
jgi:hypothetical protein